MNLLKPILGEGHNTILWNRNPDLFNNYPINDNVKSSFSTNSAKFSDISESDLVIFAGTPEWLGNPVRPVLDMLHQKSEIPAMFIGIGSGRPLNILTTQDLETLRRDNVLIICRSAGLASQINDMLGVRKAIELPCPAMFSVSPSIDLRPEKPFRLAFNLQADRISSHSISTALLFDILSKLYKFGQNTDIICHYIDEFIFFTRLGYRCRYFFDPAPYFSAFSEYDLMISTRLHGALPMLGMGRPALILASKANLRINSAASLFDKVLPAASEMDAALKWVEGMTSDGYEGIQSDLSHFRKRYYEEYQTCLKNFFERQVNINKRNLDVQPFAVKKYNLIYWLSDRPEKKSQASRAYFSREGIIRRLKRFQYKLIKKLYRPRSFRIFSQMKHFYLDGSLVDFLTNCSLYFYRAKLARIPVSKLRVIVPGDLNATSISLRESPFFKYLKGNEVPYADYTATVNRMTFSYNLHYNESVESFNALVIALDEKGFDSTRPIVVNYKNEIIDGNRRAAWLQNKYGDNYKAVVFKLWY